MNFPNTKLGHNDFQEKEILTKHIFDTIGPKKHWPKSVSVSELEELISGLTELRDKTLG